MLEFYRTPAGRKYFESEVPQIRKALQEIAEELKQKNSKCKHCLPQVFEEKALYTVYIAGDLLEELADMFEKVYPAGAYAIDVYRNKR